jgi:hypothetical protein
MGINAQASQVGTGRRAGSSVTMWIVLVTVVVVSMLTAGVVIALRNDATTPTRNVVPSITQEVPSVSQGKPSVGDRDDPMAGTVGGFTLKGGVCHQCL